MNRRTVLGVLLAVLAALAALVLADVLKTVVFSVTVAYVLYPVREWVVDRGHSRRVASATVSLLAFVGLLGLFAPMGYLLYSRRRALIEFLTTLPAELTVRLGELTVVFQTGQYLEAARQLLTSLAIAGARSMPVLALKATTFAFLVYGLLYKPEAVRVAVLGFVPPEYHDVVAAFHRRVRATLLGIYVLQAATAVATGLVAVLVFWSLGYSAPVALAVVAAVLQFVPIVGPSVLVAALVVLDLVAGDVIRAVAVAVFGLLFVGFLPDAVIRPRLADVAADLPATLYFVGFVGGVLTVGPVGFVVGPLVVALLIECVELITADLGDGEILD